MIHMILKVKVVLTYVAHTRCNDALHCAKDFSYKTLHNVRATNSNLYPDAYA